jgi:hypothetical protein
MVVLTSSAAIADLGVRRRSAVQWALLSVASGFLLFLAIHPRLLFFGDQNTYLLHGLARAGYGSLASDWLASTKSPLPLFDVLVELSWLAFGNNGFYLLQAILYLVLAAGLLLLLNCSRLELKSAFAGPLLVFTILAALWGWAPFLSPIWALLRDGFAVQTILSDKLEPSSFGIFLLMSLALFAAGQVTFACALAAVTCLFHPTYLIASAVLVLVYAAHTAVVERQPIVAAKDLVIYTVLLSPIVLFLLLQFSPSTPEAYRKAAEILVYERIPYHALPQVWISRHGFITIAMIISGALAWVGPNRRVAYVIASSGCAILVLTLACCGRELGPILSALSVATQHRARAGCCTWHRQPRRWLHPAILLPTGLLARVRDRLLDVLRSAAGRFRRYRRAGRDKEHPGGFARICGSQLSGSRWSCVLRPESGRGIPLPPSPDGIIPATDRSFNSRRLQITPVQGRRNSGLASAPAMGRSVLRRRWVWEPRKHHTNSTVS